MVLADALTTSVNCLKETFGKRLLLLTEQV